MKSKSQYLSLPQVQTLLGVKSRKTILKYIKSGQLSAFKLGGTRWRISREAMTEFLNRGQVPSGSNGKSLKEVETNHSALV
jgi:excisionase family DNA binding protein